jgi:hypothetical protein
LQEPEWVLCQSFRKEQFKIVKQNDFGLLLSDHVVEDARDAGCSLAVRQFEETFRQVQINIKPRPTVLCGKLGQRRGFSGTSRTYNKD